VAAVTAFDLAQFAETVRAYVYLRHISAKQTQMLDAFRTSVYDLPEGSDWRSKPPLNLEDSNGSSSDESEDPSSSDQMSREPGGTHGAVQRPGALPLDRWNLDAPRFDARLRAIICEYKKTVPSPPPVERQPRYVKATDEIDVLQCIAEIGEGYHAGWAALGLRHASSSSADASGSMVCDGIPDQSTGFDVLSEKNLKAFDSQGAAGSGVCGYLCSFDF
jgi:hypothetical protein